MNKRDFLPGLKTTEISMKYGISIHTLRVWIRKGILKTKQIRRVHYIDEQHFLAVLQGNMEKV